MSHIDKKLGTDPRQEWVTPDDFFEVVEREFDLDVCATRENAKYPLYFSLENGQDGLKESWAFHYSWTQVNEHRPALDVALVLTHVSCAAEWWLWAVCHATECRLLSPRVQFIAPSGIPQSSNPRDSALWGFRANKPLHCPCHIWQWVWTQ